MNKIIESHFLSLYAMALSDTDFDVSEMEMILRIAKEKGLSKEKYREILLNPEKVSFTPPKGFENKVEYLYDYARVVLADGKIDPSEHITMKMFCKKFGFMDEHVDEIIKFLFDNASNNTPSDLVIENAQNLS